MKKTLVFSVLGMLVATGCGDDDPASTSASGGSGATASGGSGGDGAMAGAGGSGADGGDGGTGAAPDGTYNFPSKYVDGESSVAYTGQIFRHTLIESLNGYIGGMTDAIDGGTFTLVSTDEVMSALTYYYEFDGASSGSDEHGVSTDPAALQTSFDDLQPGGSTLKEKMAGNDTATDHKDWNQDFVGWDDTTIAQFGGGIDTPEELLMAFFNTQAQLAIDRTNGTFPNEPKLSLQDPDVPVSHVYLTGDGRDLKQLIQKFLLMSITYSQGTDDYLHDDVEGKGLLTSNTQNEDSPYSVLEHQWDEGFGYFGGARDYAMYSDEEIAAGDMTDSNMDGAIDLLSELNFGASVNAAKRDLGAAVPTDFTKDAFDALYAGRLLIHETDGELDGAALDTLRGHAEGAVLAWEHAIVATVIHYINDTAADTATIDDDFGAYSYADHAKHFSEMKGFALGLQFNPRSPLSSEDFALLHDLIRDMPVLADATPQARSAYISDLMAARDLLEQAYGFDPANVDAW